MEEYSVSSFSMTFDPHNYTSHFHDRWYWNFGSPSWFDLDYTASLLPPDDETASTSVRSMASSTSSYVSKFLHHNSSRVSPSIHKSVTKLPSKSAGKQLRSSNIGSMPAWSSSRLSQHALNGSNSDSARRVPKQSQGHMTEPHMSHGPQKPCRPDTAEVSQRHSSQPKRHKIRSSAAVSATTPSPTTGATGPQSKPTATATTTQRTVSYHGQMEEYSIASSEHTSARTLQSRDDEIVIDDMTMAFSNTLATMFNPGKLATNILDFLLQSSYNSLVDGTPLLPANKEEAKEKMTKLLLKAFNLKKTAIARNIFRCKYGDALEIIFKTILQRTLVPALLMGAEVPTLEAAGLLIAFDPLVGVPLVVGAFFTSHLLAHAIAHEDIAQVKSLASYLLTSSSTAYPADMTLGMATFGDIAGQNTCCTLGPQNCSRGSWADWTDDCNDMPGGGRDLCPLGSLFNFLTPRTTLIEGEQACYINEGTFASKIYHYKCVQCNGNAVADERSRHCNVFAGTFSFCHGCNSVFQKPVKQEGGSWLCQNQMCPGGW